MLDQPSKFCRFKKELKKRKVPLEDYLAHGEHKCIELRAQI